ncbi:hypothetical protein Bpfe_021017 [Biomphalaria pfeifferi]|uniref:Uncharacterized protein n=1 Tax=Biomphalaria pfeifferi TaxID=112525 RepID=A0AAD8B7P3_BIOPF|nr:hypothetical protein Bpfe_021017 [Biomphalaria pfeifferi]
MCVHNTTDIVGFSEKWKPANHLASHVNARFVGCHRVRNVMLTTTNGGWVVLKVCSALMKSTSDKTRFVEIVQTVQDSHCIAVTGYDIAAAMTGR